MKLNTFTNNVERSENFESNQFTIEASGKAFMILSDGLYSNKIKAVVRELSTNAYDAHVEAGIPDRAFDVNAPTALNPVFSVRDYGVSMTHEQCMTLYTTYFKSTKNHSNDAVGCLGLGSKSPFAYADAFTVEAFLDGEHRIYAAVRDENGCPQFNLIETKPTDLERGMKVSVSVRREDVNTFAREMRSVYHYFNVKPRVTGDRDFTFMDEETIVLSGDNWAFTTGDYQKNRIIMGQIGYSFDADDLMIDDVRDEIVEFVDDASGLLIHVNIGDVDITPSRESLSFNKQTKQKIRELITKLMDDVQELVEERVGNADTLYEARVEFVKMAEQCRALRQVMNSLDNVQWCDHKLFDRVLTNTINLPVEVTRIHSSRWRGSNEKKQVTSAVMRNDVTFYHIDIRGGIGRVNAELKRQKDSYDYNGADCYLIKDEVYEAFKAAMGDMPDSAFVKSSTLAKPQRANSNGSTSTVDATEMKCFDATYQYITAENVYIRDITKAYYVTMSRGDITGWTGWRGETKFKAYVKALRKYGLINNETVYLPTPSQCKNRKLADRAEWIDINTLRTALRNKMDADLAKYNVANSKELKNIKTSAYVTMRKNGVKFATPIDNILEMAQNYDSSEIDAIIRMYDDIGWPRGSMSERAEVTIDDLKAQIFARYPMMKIAEDQYINEEKTMLIKNYVEMVDKI